MPKHKLKYAYSGRFDPAKLEVTNIDRLSTGLAPAGTKLLELGCATGFMSQYFRDTLGCQVYGVDFNKAAINQAKQFTQSAFSGDLNDQQTWIKISKNKPYEVVFASAVIEHLISPETCLKRIRKVLKSRGILIATVPNVAHWRMRLHLLAGHWQYQDYGVLDNTHLRFFTYTTFQDLVTQAGFIIQKIAIDPAGGIKYFDPIAKFFPNFYAHQIVIKAIKS